MWVNGVETTIHEDYIQAHTPRKTNSQGDNALKHFARPMLLCKLSHLSSSLALDFFSIFLPAAIFEPNSSLSLSFFYSLFPNVLPPTIRPTSLPQNIASIFHLFSFLYSLCSWTQFTFTISRKINNQVCLVLCIYNYIYIYSLYS